ncbi:MAG: MarR family transcriptional regulator [Anaerolinea sp.]|nr:MarR family transcriptional regulator [Anaerolinea sp.]
MNKDHQLRFNGSIWCNLDVALRHLDRVMASAIRPQGVTVIEWYILRALYERDGQHASELAQSVGRAATSFTPNLDKLQQRQLIERRPDPLDRRAVRIFLTPLGQQLREDVLDSAEQIDSALLALFSQDEWNGFAAVLHRLQMLEPETFISSAGGCDHSNTNEHRA